MDIRLHETGEEYQIEAVTSIAVVAAFSVTELGILGCFLFVTAPTIHDVFSLKNCMLLMLLVSQCAYLITHSLYISIPMWSAASVGLNIVNAISFALWLIFYLCSSWTRSYEVFQTTSSVIVLKIVRILLIFTCLITFGPLIAVVIPIDPDSQEVAATTANVLAGAGVFILDTFFAVNYLKYIFQKTVDTVKLRNDYKILAIDLFVIITQYGLMCSLAMAISLGIYIAFLVVASNDSQENLTLYTRLLQAVDWSVFFISFPLVIMKIKLVMLRKKKNEKEAPS
ncbi:hypothetical protein BCR33DRAFT_847011 [Rhizoclosmatium globosum]|uniref:G-protein coupled receptors family 1 profile domain-containing protein n=1 Tax=Rhizoclosmatium globosum TaxID=329046 RepID=A0A1Y2CUQ0_9FUNG|nr:hypothetical protein BCR33DRAFT_847011 [Rhizoclosmatium globosum]|eukprot:ORY50564.1 hypothetical protein BCR33DRAFT_847011 [Rhizoclosmatium globosum]